jgi:hypothetical protein
MRRRKVRLWSQKAMSSARSGKFGGQEDVTGDHRFAGVALGSIEGREGGRAHPEKAVNDVLKYVM